MRGLERRLAKLAAGDHGIPTHEEMLAALDAPDREAAWAELWSRVPPHLAEKARQDFAWLGEIR